MWIGRTAKAAGVNAQTLRYYERRGLIPRPARRGSGYREYSDDAVRIVRFIRRAQDLGFSLDEIEQLIALRGVRRGERHRVRAVAERKIDEIDRKIAQLHAIRAALAQLVRACHRGTPAECPIIDALAGDGAEA
jgi:Cu(I)-responsive transcriptional regulator